jgi:hypothetical protein
MNLTSPFPTRLRAAKREKEKENDTITKTYEVTYYNDLYA